MHFHLRQITQTINGIGQAIGTAQVTLLNIPVDDDRAIRSDSRQEHFHLLNRGVLGLIENDKGSWPKGASAHIGKGRRDNPSVTKVIIHRATAQTFIQNFSKCFDVNAKFFIDIAWQET